MDGIKAKHKHTFGHRKKNYFFIFQFSGGGWGWRAKNKTMEDISYHMNDYEMGKIKLFCFASTAAISAFEIMVVA